MDDFIIDRMHQPLVDRISSLTGIGRHPVSLVLLWISFVPGIADIRLSGGHLSIVVSSSWIMVLPVYLYFTFIIGIYRRLDRNSVTHMPRYRLTYRPTRILFVLTGVFSCYAPHGFGFPDMIWNIVGWAIFVSSIFFPACQPGPPRKKITLPKFSFGWMMPAPIPA